MNDLFNMAVEMSELLSGQELIDKLSVFPEYDESIKYESQAIRLMALADIHKLYIPSQMSLDIYCKLYLALLRSLQKKGTQTAIKQQYQNHRSIQQQAYRGIIGGSDSFTVIGLSGIGKSSAIDRAISLIVENPVIEIEKPYTKIIPVLVVQCPFDSSVKGLLLEVLRKVDEMLESSYYSYALKSRATTDMLLGSVSQVALNHIGLLIVDEIQNVVNSRNGKNLISTLTQLINNSGISIGMVGTPESVPFFEQAMHLARRSVGLQYTAMPYDSYFESFCKVIFSYQYIQNESEISPAIIRWLYEHSAGMVSVVVSLIHDAQEIAILTGTETLNIETLNQAYEQRLSLLHGYIQPTITHGNQTGRTRKKVSVAGMDKSDIKLNNQKSLVDLVAQAKVENQDIVTLLKENFIVVEVAV